MTAKETNELFPDLTPRTVRDLCLEVNLSKQRVWILIKAGRVPPPVQVSKQKWVWGPKVFAAAVAAVQSGRQDNETQKTMRHRLRVRREVDRHRKVEERARKRAEEAATRRAQEEMRLKTLEATP